VALDAREVIRFTAGTTGGWNTTVNRTLLPKRTYVEERTGYRYETDSHGRIDAAEGNLIDEAGTRNAYQQAKSGGRDRLDTDHGGHLFATIFRGPGERINLVPMDSNLNQGVWKAMENRWARALERGKTVRVSLRLDYDEHRTRPKRFEVKYQIEGRPIVVRTFQNRPGGE